MQDQAVTLKSGPREVFLQLLSIITLYLSVISLISLWFRYLNFFFHTPSFYFSASTRTYLACLIVSFPIYLYTIKTYRLWIQENASLSTIRIKVWLSYFTLFLASLCIVIDLIVLITYFLDGDLTTNFLSKVAILLIICSLVFYYYHQDLKQGWQKTPLRYFASGACILVLATLATGFTLTGSPLKARLANFDLVRINDLSSVQNQLFLYWKNNQTLPTSLVVLTNEISGYKVPVDPQTQTAYDYQVLSTNSFQLCAQFNLASADTNITNSNFDYGYYGLFNQNTNWNWQHPAGRFCFTRIIDSKNNP